MYAPGIEADREVDLVPGRGRPSLLDELPICLRICGLGPARLVPPLPQPSTRVWNGALDPLQAGDAGCLLPALCEQRTPRRDAAFLAGAISQDVVGAADLDDDGPSVAQLDQRHGAVRPAGLVDPQLPCEARQVKARHEARPVERASPTQVATGAGQPLHRVVPQRPNPVHDRTTLYREDGYERCDAEEGKADQASQLGTREEAEQDCGGAEAEQRELGGSEAQEHPAAVAAAEHVGGGGVLRRHRLIPSLFRGGRSVVGLRWRTHEWWLGIVTAYGAGQVGRRIAQVIPDTRCG